MAEAARKAHGKLYEAISRRDASGAVRVMRKHLNEFAARAERFSELRPSSDGSPRFS
jgi:DNA-binding FadR family transcriptional regulator